MIKRFAYLIFINLLCLSFTSKADEITLESIPSTEGAGLICRKNKIEINIYGETYRGKITVIKNSNRYQVISNAEYYNVPIYYHDDNDENIKSEVVFTVTKRYFIQNKKVVSAISSDPIDKEKAEEELSLISIALKEAHENKKCLSWNIQ
ncbi:hypothetical protein A9G28_04045 [Gilliamella sp. Fer1-1]|jgi:hypothetical protein|uniref:hypothetical protein n=1 Tax=unclassified Gilliamella TaxID=2685620 RepID=UPI00080DBF94|nr:hypothetical protein [Gilliamella apicola]OCG43395.1 hypothetical protein A9G28_04045 [Gilliamella apicola]OCG55484.1 hypothetical protein A9G30_03250 [Gilliamella apicola]OCG76276.1 hypothetical protein A9G42_08060 [Gilliamella apicola]